MREHPNLALMRRTLDAFRSGDVSALARIFSPDVVWRVPGRSFLAKDYAVMPDLPSRTLTFTGRIRSFSFAIRGIATMLRSQQNAWLHAAATIAIVVAGAFFGISRLEWCWIVLSVVAVWTAEALNTALEFLTDVVSPDFHPIAGHAKDVAAGAVLIAAIGSALVGLLVLGPHVLAWLGA